MKKYRDICRKFSCIDGFEGWVIAKAEYKFLNEISEKKVDEEKIFDESNINDEAARVLKKKKRFAVLEADGMKLYLIKPQDRAAAENKVTEACGGQKSEKICFANIENTDALNKKKIYRNLIYKKSYSRDDIIKFTDDVKDYNPIHRTEKPIVPGLLMLESLLEAIVGTDIALEDIERVMITFEKPLFVDEVLYVYEKTDSGIIDFYHMKSGNEDYDGK